MAFADPGLCLSIAMGSIAVARALARTRADRDDASAALQAEAGRHRQTTQELIDQKNLLRTLIDAIPDLIYIKDADGRYLLNNKAHLSFLGADRPNQIAGKSVFDLFAPELAEKYRVVDERVTKSGELVIGEIEPTQDHAGNARWMSTTKIPIKNSIGEIVGLVGIARDITRRQQAESALRESEMRFGSVAQSACDAIVSCDAAGKIIFWNKAAEAIFGYTKAEAIGQPVSILSLEPTLLDARRQDVNNERDGDGPHVLNQTLELTGVRKDGSHLPIELSLAMWKTQQGKFFTKTIRDITARKLTEHALRAANETLEQKVAERSAAAEQRALALNKSEQAYREQTAILQSILDGIGDCVVVADESGRFVMCNPAAEELLGQRSDSMVGRAWSSLYEPLLADKITPIPLQDRPLARALRGEVVNEAEVFLQKAGVPNGIWLSATARPLRDEKGGPRGGVLVYHDVTERKSVEAELSKAKEAAEAANRAKSEFLANMSHEIRTPMTAILGFADRMLAPNQGLSDLQNFVHIIRRNGQHLLNLINDILDLSKIEAGQMTTEKIACNLPQMLGDLRSLMRPRALEKGLEFKLSFDGPIPRQIETDPLRMKQILVNLIGNAIKFTPGGRITLNVACDATGPAMKLRFDVTDTGIGMSEQQLSRLFQPFTQADESTTRRFGGTGLGLTISRQLANLLDGDVVVKSRLGVGSTFTALIDGGPSQGIDMVPDLVEASLPATQNINTCRDMKFHGRILLAEDGRDNQRLLMEILSGAGAAVTLAENGRIAVELATSQPFDLILMDMQMPELDGYGAATELRQLGCKAPIIALTAHAMSEDRDKCLASGCDGFLTKPIELESFLHTIGGYLKETQITAPPAGLTYGNPMPSRTDRITSSYAQVATMKKILGEFVADLPGLTCEMKQCLSNDRLDNVRRIAHQLRGAGGGYGFAELTERAARVEQAVKDQQPLEQITQQFDRLVDYMRRIDGYNVDAERGRAALANAA